MAVPDPGGAQAEGTSLRLRAGLGLGLLARSAWSGRRGAGDITATCRGPVGDSCVRPLLQPPLDVAQKAWDLAGARSQLLLLRMVGQEGRSEVPFSSGSLGIGA